MKIKVLVAFLLCAFLAAGSVSANQQPGKKGAPADSTEQFADRIVSSKIPVVLDFWAAWCMPCRWLDPIIEELEKEYKGRVLFMKIDVDVHRGISAYFKVNSIPSVYVIEDKTVRAALNGVRPKEHYKAEIEKALKMAADRDRKDTE